MLYYIWKKEEDFKRIQRLNLNEKILKFFSQSDWEQAINNEHKEEVIDKSNLSMSGLKKNSTIKRVDEESRKFSPEADRGIESTPNSKNNNIELKVLSEEWPKTIEW